MIHVYWWLASLSALWFETALSHYAQIAGLKVNIVLMVLLILMLRWKSPYFLFYGLMVGLMTDALSHAMIGVNGLSFFLILILTRWVGEWFYNRSVVSTMLFVGGLSFIEGGIALTLLKLLDFSLPWNRLFFQVVPPLVLVQGLFSPLFLFLLTQLERFLHLHPEKEMWGSWRY